MVKNDPKAKHAARSGQRSSALTTGQISRHKAERLRLREEVADLKAENLELRSTIDAVRTIAATHPNRSDLLLPLTDVHGPHLGNGQPDDTWTLTQMRCEALRRGLTGTSALHKAELLARLRSE